uniref:Uncharacterized protein n=1 Tax=Plectus sambesii TaxID=2011161 RepID=A0A914WX34_9BILA
MDRGAEARDRHLNASSGRSGGHSLNGHSLLPGRLPHGGIRPAPTRPISSSTQLHCREAAVAGGRQCHL